MSNQNAQRVVVGAPALGRTTPTLSTVTDAGQSVLADAGQTGNLVIAGIDCSGCARDAAQWAAAEAVRRNAVLEDSAGRVAMNCSHRW